MSLDYYEEKWIRKCRANKAKWLAMVKKAESLEAYIKGVARITKLPESVIRASAPVDNWTDFQAKADEFVEIWISNIEAAARAKKWSTGYVEAFKTPAS